MLQHKAELDKKTELLAGEKAYENLGLFETSTSNSNTKKRRVEVAAQPFFAAISVVSSAEPTEAEETQKWLQISKQLGGGASPSIRQNIAESLDEVKPTAAPSSALMLPSAYADMNDDSTADSKKVANTLRNNEENDSL